FHYILKFDNVMMKDIHDIRHVMDRIERIGGSILTHRPFFMVHLMFYGARQFFRDLAYSCAQNNRSRSEFDILMGSIAMDY
ncbi:MAG: hypothetical protein EBV36_06410, partial [Burkholderiaceae bacterium]|nr:hypothetical protein [Burkholderiaceae bacterium]